MLESCVLFRLALLAWLVWQYLKAPRENLLDLFSEIDSSPVNWKQKKDAYVISTSSHFDHDL
jgi:hypothetical protein